MGYLESTLAFGDPVRPFQHSFWGTPLPANATVDPNSAATVAELAGMAAKGTNLNVWSFTAEPIIVPANQPLVPVTFTGSAGNSQLAAVLKLGVPIPPGTKPTADSDASLCIWQPDYQSPRLSWPCQGRYFGLWKVAVDASGNYSAQFGGRMNNVNNDTGGHFVTWTASGEDPAGYATDPDSTYTMAGWGETASSLPLMPSVLSLADVKANHVNHALGLLTPDSLVGKHVWPAQRSDGGMPASNVMEGQRLRFPAGYQIPAGLHPLAQLIVQGVRDYGCVILDKTDADCAFRAAPSVGSKGFLGSSPDYNILNGFPWADLQLLAVGSDSNPTPTS